MRAERRDSIPADQGLVLMSPDMVCAFLLLMGFAFGGGAAASFLAAAAVAGGLLNKYFSLEGNAEVEYEILNSRS